MKKAIIISVLLGFVGTFGLFALTVKILDGSAPDSKQTSNIQNTTFRDGDIIFQTSRSDQSKAIQLATNSRYSHMGIIYKMADQYYVYEAVQPVKLTRMDAWIKRGENSRYVIKRLKNSEAILTSENLNKMKRIGERFKGKDYDIYFEWSDDKIYCSELVWKIYKEAFKIEIGQLQNLRDFDLSSDVVKEKMLQRYGDHIPLDEPVISPASMFDSDKSETVFDNYGKEH
jgi:hypothetical protein